MHADLGTDMYEDGYHNITSIDFSPVIIEKQAKKHAEKTEMKCAIRRFSRGGRGGGG
jgi:hypothetical protein